MKSVIELDSDKLYHPPSIRRNAPNCLTALIEASARSQFGVARIDKAWFGHSFVYERLGEQIGLMNDGLTLNVRLTPNAYAVQRLEDKLRHYYGLRLWAETFESFECLISAVQRALEAGEVVISNFGVGFMKGRREYGDAAAGLGHLMSPVRLDLVRGTMSGIENIEGLVEVDLTDYAKCFEARRSRGMDFGLWHCQKEPGHVEQPVLPSEIKRDLEHCLNNLFSESPHQGLRALSSAAEDVWHVASWLKVPVYVPVLWMFFSDRYGLLQNLTHWRAAGMTSNEAIEELEVSLRSVLNVWAGVNALLEAAIVERDAAGLADLEVPLRQVVSQEARLANLLEEIYHGLS